jgi:hypothetical protein
MFALIHPDPWEGSRIFPLDFKLDNRFFNLMVSKHYQYRSNGQVAPV